MSSYFNQVGVTVHGLILATSTVTTTTAPKKTTGSSATTLLIFVLLFAALYFLVIRPRSQRNRRVVQQRGAANIGDEVMLTSGIIGRVTSIDGDRATVEIAPEIEVEVVLRAIGQVLEPADAALPIDVPPDPGHDDANDYDDDEDDAEHDASDEHDEHDEHVEHDDQDDDHVNDNAGPSVEPAPGEAGAGVTGEAAEHLGTDGPRS
jgi:preprotein translocase subunit YajC